MGRQAASGRGTGADGWRNGVAMKTSGDHCMTTSPVMIGEGLESFK